jgi:hypothetical protein
MHIDVDAAIVVLVQEGGNNQENTKHAWVSSRFVLPALFTRSNLFIVVEDTRWLRSCKRKEASTPTRALSLRRFKDSSRARFELASGSGEKFVNLQIKTHQQTRAAAMESKLLPRNAGAWKTLELFSYLLVKDFCSRLELCRNPRSDLIKNKWWS